MRSIYQKLRLKKRKWVPVEKLLVEIKVELEVQLKKSLRRLLYLEILTFQSFKHLRTQVQKLKLDELRPLKEYIRCLQLKFRQSLLMILIQVRRD